jgi:uncharacterized membrane protein
MAIGNYLIIMFVWCFYGTYCYAQYNDSVKQTNWFMLIAIAYGLINNLLWVFLAKKLNQESTLKMALIWDSGIHFTAFLLPLFIFGNTIKTHTLVGMGFIFSGVSVIMFYDKFKSVIS